MCLSEAVSREVKYVMKAAAGSALSLQGFDAAVAVFFVFLQFFLAHRPHPLTTETEMDLAPFQSQSAARL